MHDRGGGSQAAKAPRLGSVTMLRARRSMSVEQLHAKAGFTRGYRVRTDMRQEQWCRWTSARRVLGRAVTLGMALAALALLGMAPAAGWAQSPAKSAGPTPQQSIHRKNPLLQAESWGYQLQALDEKGFAALFYDVLVMDYTKQGQAGSEFTPAELAKIRLKPNGQKRVLLSYFSVGEAENYRYYWKREWSAKKPAWMAYENKDWAGNFIVRFWDPEWRRIVFEGAESFLSRIIAAGFDGVYLDRVDVFAELEKENSNARADMIAFVRALSAKARALKPDFLVVVQNAEDLATSDPFLASIDGIAKEDLLYGVDHKASRNPQSMINEAVRHLKVARDKGKAVFVVEYLSRPEQLMNVMRELSRYDERFVPHFADRKLNRVRSERFEDMAHEDDEDVKKPVN